MGSLETTALKIKWEELSIGEKNTQQKNYYCYAHFILLICVYIHDTFMNVEFQSKTWRSFSFHHLNSRIKHKSSAQ